MEKKSNKKEVLLFHCIESQDLALKIASQSDLIHLQSINWRFSLSLSKYIYFSRLFLLFACDPCRCCSLVKFDFVVCVYEPNNIAQFCMFFGKVYAECLSFKKFIRSFDDGFPNLFINNAQDIRGQHVAFLASFSSPAVIFEQLSVIFALPRLFVASFTLVLPFFPTGSFEHMEEEGDVATAFTMARILSNIPISRGGPTSLVIYDIHALQERFYFGDHVLPCFETGIPLLKQRLHQLSDSDKIVVAFPDDGAWKRFHKQLDHFPMVVCAKVREGDKRIVRLKEGSPTGCHVVIVDDLVQSGGTLIECQKVLAAHGAAKVSAYVTHSVFPKRSLERFVHKNEDSEKAFAYFWITDSCPLTVKAIANKAPFEVLSLAGSIADALQI
ncbi:Ribose-phosphate pyrophosphokinase 4 [Camellia lanceoleosa]|uniref:Ribose-phosphate pyrophosphokinase 4 n=1 Tax=Camellia lanceoleosa TaxID=1840588 RepID=A0ACC0HGH5_9ERIC|nr:Ribose-phosphate pyrophosphokinase 4 [Camellia lanceoleosa]